MGALRAAREGMAERPSVPPGVSCSIDGQGVATVLDPGSRRRFVLAPSVGSGGAQSSVPPLSQRVEPHIPANPVPVVDNAPRPARAKKFETVAFTPDRLVERPNAVAGSNRPPAAVAGAAAHAPAPSPAPVHAPVPAPVPTKKKKFETVAFSPG